MKSTERHKLKEDELTKTVLKAREIVAERRQTVAAALGIAGIALVLLAGFSWWQRARVAAANEALASAMAVYDAQVVPVTPPTPGSAPPIPAAGTFPTERARLEAAVPVLQAAADTYPTRNAGIVARFHLAAALAALGRLDEAAAQYQQVIDKGGKSIYARTGKLGLADVQLALGQYDAAINTYTELSRATTDPLPLDSVLMQLGRAYARAGRKDEAARTFDRVVKEFPESVYAADARRELDTARKS